MGNIFDSIASVLSNRVIVDESNVADVENLLVSDNDIDGSGQSLPKDALNGFYNMEGEYLGTDNVNENKVYVITQYSLDYFTNTDGSIDWKNVKSNAINVLEMSHSDFMFSAGVISKEGTDNSTDEMVALAFTTRNAAGSIKNMTNKLKSGGFSTVPNREKTPLLMSDNTSKGKNARIGIIRVERGEPDPTDGAIQWDGEDFLAWGRNRPQKAGGGEFPKLIDGVEISKEIYDKYYSAILAAHPSGKISYKRRFGEVYDIPAPVFQDQNNWFENGTLFRYRTNGEKPLLKASFSAGRSIFWKKISQ